jgi:hypothetical protein
VGTGDAVVRVAADGALAARVLRATAEAVVSGDGFVMWVVDTLGGSAACRAAAGEGVMLTVRPDVVELVINEGVDDDEVDGEAAAAGSARDNSGREIVGDCAPLHSAPTVAPPDEEVQPVARAIAATQITAMPALNPAIALSALGHRRFPGAIDRLVAHITFWVLLGPNTPRRNCTVDQRSLEADHSAILVHPGDRTGVSGAL